LLCRPMGHILPSSKKSGMLYADAIDLSRAVKSMSAHRQYLPLHTATELGAALRAQRKSQELTLEQLSGLSGLGMRFLSELERGKATAELGKALEVARLLGLDCYLIPRSQSPGPARMLEHGDAG